MVNSQSEFEISCCAIRNLEVVSAPGSEARFDRCGVTALTVTPVGVELPGIDCCSQAAQWELTAVEVPFRNREVFRVGVVDSMDYSGALFFDLCIPEFLSHQLKI